MSHEQVTIVARDGDCPAHIFNPYRAELSHRFKVFFNGLPAIR